MNFEISNRRKKLSGIIILIITLTAFSSLFSCRSTRITYLKDTNGEFCLGLERINGLILNDKEMLNYFSFFKKDSLIFYKDSTISFGFHLFFMYDLALIRDSIDSTKNQHETYYELEQEYLQYNSERKKIIVSCNKNDFLKKNSDLEINYWYNPKDNVFSIDIVEILKEPGHRQGYMFLIKKNHTDIEILKRSQWTE